MQISPARRAAFEILRRVETENAYASSLLAALGDEMRNDDRALCHELVLGVLRRQLWLDRVVEHFAGRRMEDVDLPVRLALRMGLYQLRFLSRIPPSAAVNESVNLVRVARLKSAASFVNAVLRRVTREPAYDPAALVADRFEKLAIETSHPQWLIERWSSEFGVEEAALLARANNDPAPVAFRFTPRAKESEGGTQRIIDDLIAAGAELLPSKITPESWRVEGHRTAGDGQGVSASKLVRQLSQSGLIYFQDEASQLVAHLLDAQSGDRVLDVCAAPGSKTTHIAALSPQALIVAGDFYGHRLRTLRELARQQGVDGIHLVVHDATRNLPFVDAAFDRVLVDAPCSGTGTLRLNPEIRWRIQPSDIAELSSKQNQILANAAGMVRPGGVLIYSTCSLELDENETVVQNFINTRPEFDSLQLNAPPGLLTDTGAVRTWPHRQGSDGFFTKALHRRT
jgi:16S rRNA (cytosine967-C5)-methyltransferase